jgi:hypothetical protein
LLSIALAFGVTVAMVAWADQKPERVLVGLSGRHDGARGNNRLAACLDCHVPFVGTPGSRCLSPGCHGMLATGTPPREGRAMPIRFHSALREQPCGLCHTEHSRLPASTRAFSHEMIPPEPRKLCSRCHSAYAVANHARTDAIICSTCHSTKQWGSTLMDHQKVAQQFCDLCHTAPANATHASVAGTCSTCHIVASWTVINKHARDVSGKVIVPGAPLPTPPPTAAAPRPNGPAPAPRNPSKPEPPPPPDPPRRVPIIPH